MPMQVVLRTLLQEPTQARYGLELAEAAGLPSGTLHPILARLEQAEWVSSQWEDRDPRAAGRPRRRYYSLTPRGAELARVALAERTRTGAAVRTLRPGLAAPQ